MPARAVSIPSPHLWRAVFLSIVSLALVSCESIDSARSYRAVVRVGEIATSHALAVDIVWTENAAATNVIGGVTHWFEEKSGVLAAFSGDGIGVVSREVVPSYAEELLFETRSKPKAIFVFVTNANVEQTDLVRRYDGADISFDTIDISIQRDGIEVSTR